MDRVAGKSFGGTGTESDGTKPAAPTADELTIVQRADLLSKEARQFASLIFWVLDLRARTFTATGEAGLIPEWGLGRAVPLRTMWARLAPEDRRGVVAALRQTTEQKEAVEGVVRFLRFSGLRRHIEIRAYPILDYVGKVIAIQGLAREVTDRVMADLARRQLAGQYRDFIRFSPHMPWIADSAGRIVEMSANYEVVTGAPRTVWESDAWIEHFHPSDVPGMVAAVTQALATGESYSSEYRVRFRDGQYRWFRASAVAHRDESGLIVAWYGLTENIDRLKRAEAGLNAGETQRRNPAGPASARAWRRVLQPGDRRSAPTFVALGSTPGPTPAPTVPAPSPPPAEADQTQLTYRDMAPLIEGGHLRAARALLDWSMAELASAADLSFSTIRRLEEATQGATARSLRVAVEALQKAGIHFSLLANGSIAVSKRASPPAPPGDPV